MKFKVGDIVETIGSSWSERRIGSKGKIIGIRDTYFRIKWIEDGKEGEYNAEGCFRVIGSTKRKEFKKKELKEAKIRVTKKDVIIR